MKKLVFSMLAMAAMVSCTSESDPMNDVDGGEKVEIKMSAGIGGIIVKSAGPVLPEAAVDNVGFLRYDGIAEATDVNLAELTGNSPIGATIAANTGNITFASAQYYDIDAANRTSFIGYHPIDKSTLNKNIVTYINIDGQQDIMCSNIVSGNKENKQTTKLSPSFVHKLTQLSFNIKASDANAVTAWGSVTKIEVINQQTSASLTLEKNSVLTFTGDATNSILVGSTSTSFDPSPSTPVSFGIPVMINPLANPTVKITTTKYTNGVDVPLTVAGTASTAYVVTLTFQGTVIAAEATIGNWIPGTGSGTVE